MIRRAFFRYAPEGGQAPTGIDQPAACQGKRETSLLSVPSVSSTGCLDPTTAPALPPGPRLASILKISCLGQGAGARAKVSSRPER